MSDDFRDSLWRIAERLVSLAGADERIRDDLQAVANALLRLTAPPAAPADDEPADQAAVDSPAAPPASQGPGEAAPSPEPAAPRFRAAELARQLTFAQPRAAETARPEEAPTDLAAVEKRCLLKAEGARWAIERRRRMAEGASFDMEIEPKDREIIEQGKQVETYLWMNNPAGPCPSDPTAMEDVANCFEATAAALAVVRGVLNESPPDQDNLAQALNLLAEAQCMLRTAVTAVGWHDDREQSVVHGWLRGACYRHQIYVPRFMRLNDVADPRTVSDLAERIEQLDERLEGQRGLARKHRKLLGKLRYHANQIQNGVGDAGYNWTKVIAAADELIADGTPPSSVAIRELLLPIIDGLPDDLGEADLPDRFRQAMRQIDRYLASQVRQESAPVREVSEDVRRVGELLEGRKVTLVGGLERPNASRAIRDAFRLRELVWVRSEEHQSVSTFESHVADPEVALVILMIRWSSHSYGELQGFCDKYGKPLLRLPGGYNPSQIAHQILQQVSDRLAEQTIP